MTGHEYHNATAEVKIFHLARIQEGLWAFEGLLNILTEYETGEAHSIAAVIKPIVHRALDAIQPYQGVYTIATRQRA